MSRPLDLTPGPRNSGNLAWGWRGMRAVAPRLSASPLVAPASRMLTAIVITLLMLACFLVIVGYAPPARAAACPPGCWKELNCCCITPCPVADGDKLSEFLDIVSNIMAANQVYGAVMPVLDSVGQLSTPVDPESLRSAGLIALQQGWRNALRGVDQSALGVSLAMPDLALPELELESVDLAPVPARLGEAPEVESLRRELDSAYWTSQIVSTNETAAGKSKRHDATGASAINAYARALMKRADVAAAAADNQGIERRLTEARTISDDFRLNSEARALLSRDLAEVHELLTLWIEARASQKIDADPDYVATPRHEVAIQAPPAPDTTTRDFMQSRSACLVASRETVRKHNALTDINRLRGYLPVFMASIDEHDARTAHSWDTQNEIMSVLGRLYQDPEAAWTALAADLAGLDRTSYIDQSRYGSARQAIERVLPALVAQSATTRYGKRVSTQCRPRVDRDGRTIQDCLPFTSPFDKTDGPETIQAINAYYAAEGRGDDAYNRYGGIATSSLAAAARAGKDQGGPPSAEAYFQVAVAKLQTLLEYRQEAEKRRIYWSLIRRGGEGDADQFGRPMSQALFGELAAYDRSCFYGPVGVSQESLRDRRDWLDLSPTCGHHAWQSGAAAGEEISHGELGGIDASIWAIENSTRAYKAEFKGRAEIEEWAGAASRACQAASQGAASAGRSDLLPGIEASLAVIGRVKADYGNALLLAAPPLGQ